MLLKLCGKSVEWIVDAICLSLMQCQWHSSVPPVVGVSSGKLNTTDLHLMQTYCLSPVSSVLLSAEAHAQALRQSCLPGTHIFC